MLGSDADSVALAQSARPDPTHPTNYSFKDVTDYIPGRTYI